MKIQEKYLMLMRTEEEFANLVTEIKIEKRIRDKKRDPHLTLGRIQQRQLVLVKHLTWECIQREHLHLLAISPLGIFISLNFICSILTYILTHKMKVTYTC